MGALKPEEESEDADMRSSSVSGVPPSHGKHPRSGPAPRPPRILVADPDQQVRDWLRRPLSQLAADVCEAKSGLELEAFLRQKGPFDLVITNAQLPAQSGLQVLARARAQGKMTPFIVVTSIYQTLLRVFVSDAEGTVLSSRMVDGENLTVLASTLIARSRKT